MYYYSPSTKGFYKDGIHPVIPDDKIEITDEEHAELLAKQNIAIGPSGKPENKPSAYHTLNSAGGAWEITSENQAKKDGAEAEAIRLADITQAKDDPTLKKRTVQQAYDFIDNKLDAAGSAAEVKEAIRDILKKMIPYILN